MVEITTVAVLSNAKGASEEKQLPTHPLPEAGQDRGCVGMGVRGKGISEGGGGYGLWFLSSYHLQLPTTAPSC